MLKYSIGYVLESGNTSRQLLQGSFSASLGFGDPQQKPGKRPRPPLEIAQRKGLPVVVELTEKPGEERMFF